MAEIEAGNLYDMNKSLVAKYEKHLKGKALQNRIDNTVVPYFNEKIPNETYFMLLCHEQRDYTVFRVANGLDSSANAVQMLKECLENRGAIYGIDRTEDKVALEIWLRSNEDGEMYCYYFFPYTKAVIEV